jgi:putative FmdB family regulatory protein
MIYDYECPKCGDRCERYVHTFDQADEEYCDCGERLTRLISSSRAVIDVFEKTHIPEIDPNIRFKSWDHAKQVCRDKGLRYCQEPAFPKDFDYNRRASEKRDRHVCSILT